MGYTFRRRLRPRGVALPTQTERIACARVFLVISIIAAASSPKRRANWRLATRPRQNQIRNGAKLGAVWDDFDGERIGPRLCATPKSNQCPGPEPATFSARCTAADRKARDPEQRKGVEEKRIHMRISTSTKSLGLIL